MPEETEYTPELTSDEGATASAGKDNRRTVAAYQQIQSEKDRALQIAQQATNAAQQAAAEAQALRQRLEEQSLRQSLAGLPEDEANRKLSDYQWAQKELKEKQLEQRALAAEQRLHAYQTTEGARSKANELFVSKGLPPTIGGIDVRKILLDNNGGSPEAMEALAEKLAKEYGGKPQTSAKKAQSDDDGRRHSRFAGEAGPSVPQKPMAAQDVAIRNAFEKAILAGKANWADADNFVNDWHANRK